MMLIHHQLDASISDVYSPLTEYRMAKHIKTKHNEYTTDRIINCKAETDIIVAKRQDCDTDLSAPPRLKDQQIRCLLTEDRISNGKTYL